MAKRCAWGTYNSDSRYLERLKRENGGTVNFISFANAKMHKERRKAWIRTCCCGDNFVCTKDSYICNLHFIGKFGPTEENPDPITASTSVRFLCHRILENVKLYSRMANGTCTLSMLCFCKLGSSGSLLGPYNFYKIGSIKGGFGTSLRDSDCVNNTIEIHALAHSYHRHVGRLCLCSRNKRVRFCVFFSKKDCVWRFSNV